MDISQTLRGLRVYIHYNVEQARRNLVPSTILEQLIMDTEVQPKTLV